MLRPVLIWTGVAATVTFPLIAAAFSPLLAWREPVYILAGFAGIFAMGLLLLQPLLATGALPGLEGRTGRRLHRWGGIALLFGVGVHVGGLWITSPPDVIDVLLIRSPTPFAIWGVMAMWALCGAALVAALRHRLRIPFKIWRTLHLSLAGIVAVGTILHAVLIQGTMETVTKWLLAAAISAVLIRMVWQLTAKGRPRRQA